jgi:hypothetical protein
MTYVGNGGIPFSRSDLNFDGTITAADWIVFTTYAATSMAGLSKAQSYGRGDLDGDGDNDYNDFKLFKSDYTLAHGAGSFEAMLSSVPEPTAFYLIVASIIVVAPIRKQRIRERTLSVRSKHPLYFWFTN